MPVDGVLRQMIFVPGQLFSVSPGTVDGVNNLFARNERLVCIFDTQTGPMAVILVGAIFVASIAVAWQGVITPKRYYKQTTWHYPATGQEAISLQRGEELGHFIVGSTVITLFGAEQVQWAAEIAVGAHVKFGQCIGEQNLAISSQINIESRKY